MSHVIASPFGLGLPYPALFLVPKRKSTKRRPANYFWEKATAPTHPVTSYLHGDNTHLSPHSPATSWLDEESVAVFSDSEDERVIRKPGLNLSKKKSFAKMREIAFRAFLPKPGSTKSSTVVATEIVSQQHLSPDHPLAKANAGHGGFTLFNSWRLKSKGSNTKVKKLSAMVKRRINSRSPAHLQPKTWEEYHRCYAAEQIDINDPPLPPTESNPDKPTAWEAKTYAPPLADDEAVRQLVINRLGVFGAGFDESEGAAAEAQKREELAKELEAKGQEPRDLQRAWDRTSTAPDIGLDETRTMMKSIRSGNLPPETLEQHPVFRKIVRQCREMFGTNISMLSIMTGESQIFLAESGLSPLRAAPRELTVCAHTVLSGRKGFTILDIAKDWRFASSPLVSHYNARFYSGVPLMAPNLDGAAESDEAACPIGTLCVIDDKPREEFGIEERKKLVYMAEYARREIEEWFKTKLAVKMEVLEESHKVFVENVALVGPVEDEAHDMPTETLHDSGNNSFASTPPTSLSSAAGSPANSSAQAQGPNVFDDPIALIKPKMQKVFDLATKLVGETLDLSLVYLIAVAPHGDSTTMGRTLVLSGFNLPSPPPTFDAGLHLRVLRTPEGGLLYQNPSSEEVQEAGLDSVANSNPYASAMLVRLGPEPIGNAGGFVMAGFTSNPKRVFGGEDVAYVRQFASELNRYTHKLKV